MKSLEVFDFDGNCEVVMSGSSFFDRVAAAPISWGVCEVPGWGKQLSPEQVLREMRDLGFSATELGSAGWLPEDVDQLKSMLAGNELELLGAFVPLVLHDKNQLEVSLKSAEGNAKLLAECGAKYFIDAPVMSFDWAPRRPLGDDEWTMMGQGVAEVSEICAQYSLEHVIHEHHNIAIEQKEDVEKLLEISDVKFVLDTGHLSIGGFDPLEFAKKYADRVGLIHLKDASLSVEKKLKAEEITLLQAVQQGIFQPLGQGDLPVADVVNYMESQGFSGWYVIEQDCVIAEETDESPAVEVKKSLDFLRDLKVQVA